MNGLTITLVIASLLGLMFVWLSARVIGQRTALTVLAALFVIARASHVMGMGANANLKFCQAGIFGSFAAIGSACLYGLFLGLV